MSLRDICLALDEALASRRIGDGISAIHENRDAISSIVPSQEHSGSLIGHLAIWIDMDTSLSMQVENLLVRFPKTVREGISYRDSVYLRLADGVLKMNRGSWRLAIQDLEFVLSANIEDANLRLVTTYNLARCWRRCGGYKKAMEYVLSAEELVADCPMEGAIVCILKSWLLHQDGKSEEASRLADQVERTLADTDDYVNQGNALSVQARIKQRRDLRESVPLFLRAVECFRKGDPKHPNLGRALANVALVKILLAHNIQKRKERRIKRDSAYLDVQDYCNRDLKMELRQSIRQIASELRVPAPDKLAIRIGDAIDQNIQRKIETLSDRETASGGRIQNLGLLALDMKQRFEAMSGNLPSHGNADRLRKLGSLIDDILGQINGLSGAVSSSIRKDRLASVREECNDLMESAQKDLGEAEAIYEELGYSKGLGTCSLRKAFMLLDQGAIDLAEAAAKRAYDLGGSMEKGEPVDPFLRGRALILECKIENEKLREGYGNGSPELALQYAAEAIECAESTQSSGLRSRAQMAMAFALLNLGTDQFDARKAWHHYKLALDSAANGHMIPLDEDFQRLVDMLIDHGVVKSDLADWLLKRDKRDKDDLEDCLYLLAYEVAGSPKGVAELLNVSLNNAKDRLAKLGVRGTHNMRAKSHSA
jgi:tetratricopeptide (TPR) repeat protein